MTTAGMGLAAGLVALATAALAWYRGKYWRVYQACVNSVLSRDVDALERRLDAVQGRLDELEATASRCREGRS